MTDLILHVGHAKTGSSYLQSSLALSVSSLAKQGFYYPASRNFDRAKLGHVNAGNTSAASFAEDVFSAVEDMPSGQTLLFSNESINVAFAEDSTLAARISARFDNVTIIVFLRDILDLFRSLYVQGIKRGGFTMDIDAFADTFDYPKEIADFLELASNENWHIEANNYSRMKESLLPCFEASIGLAPGALDRPPIDRVNRSLSRSEQAVQRSFNKTYGKDSSRFIADAFCNDMHLVTPYLPMPSAESLATLSKRVEEDVVRINALLSPDAAIAFCEPDVLVQPDETDDDEYSFSQAQLDLLAKELSAIILQRDLTNRLFPILRKMRPGDVISQEDAVTLWELGLFLRPNANGLRNRLDRFADKRKLDNKG